MKWLGVKGDRIVATVYAPDKATAEGTLGFHTKTHTIFHLDAVMSAVSYEESRRVDRVIQRDHKPVKLWEKSK